MQSAAAFNPTIHPAGEAVTAGPWQLTLQRAELGNSALSTLQAANIGNEDAPLDLQWVIAYMQATNTSDQPMVIGVSDFAICGAEGVMYRTPLTDGPHPLLQGIVGPGETIEGAIPCWAGDLSNVLLQFSSPFLGGNWADAWFALTDGATLPTFESPGDDAGLGTSPDFPAAFGDTVRSGDFEVTVLRYVTGQEAYDIAPTGVRALALWDDIGNWHSFLLRVRNVADKPRFFSFVALRLTDFTGEPWDHLLQLGAPLPDVAKELLPGATMEGWCSIQTLSWASLDLLRVQNNAITGDPRYIAFSDTVRTSNAVPTPHADLAVGDVVTITTTPLNLRDTPSTSGEIVTELDGSSTLTITGEAIDADGFTWYPVTVTDTGEKGYVAGNYLAP
ncbi:MAG: SH3 domain-containing protein [Thermomicrobiales bacterium]|nr:SH3 domain-containing protein [Thermomicrobiales bacterium]